MEALGSNATAIVNVVTALAESKAKFVTDVLVAGGGNGNGAFEGLAATAMRFLATGATRPSGPSASPGGEAGPAKSANKIV